MVRTRQSATTLVAFLVLSLLLAACSPTPGPATSPPMPTPTPAPTPAALPSPAPGTLPEGTTALDIIGRVKGTCPAWPGGCRYWVTLIAAGGTAFRAELERLDQEQARLTLGAGLPPTLPGGSYALVFELEQISDMVDVNPDGSQTIPSYLWIACVGKIEPGAAIKESVRVVFEGNGCTVRTVEIYD